MVVIHKSILLRSSLILEQLFKFLVFFNSIVSSLFLIVLPFKSGSMLCVITSFMLLKVLEFSLYCCMNFLI